ncbi:hypothetical protein CSH63_24200 [Micromonospora tulbaghiae]|uniref:Uncharacterized protein n=1 Tax=Micromonospora tulbaghiae TaxID=479978 RepID=A0A386WR29_9ACTN|nr:hypothetical protein [Micromonospora tulbaghiae]AYF30493.1 hypothetical protein CSH63_24200 [Micromonospora tulbaghiae]
MTAQSDVYSDFIASELKTERERKAAMDTRAASLVTTSGSLVTILAAVGAFVGKDAQASLPRQALPLMVLALVAFTAASLSGICAGWSRRYDVAAITPMRLMLNERWTDDEDLARKEVALANIAMIGTLRSVNETKERFLRAGWISQIVALGFLAAVVLIILATR